MFPNRSNRYTPRRALKVECDRCGISRTISSFDVVSGTVDLGLLSRRLKCNFCGAREATLAILVPASTAKLEITALEFRFYSHQRASRANVRCFRAATF